MSLFMIWSAGIWKLVIIIDFSSPGLLLTLHTRLITVPIIFIFRETPEELLELLTTHRALDRRRLEEAFLLFGCLAVMKKYNLSLPDIPCNRNELAQAITGKFHDAFVQRWEGECA